MNFRSILPTYHTNFLLGYTDKTVWLGSCFTEAIGEKVSQRKFPALINPFGNIFNPLSLALHLQRSVQTQPLQENEIVFQNELWHSWHHHGNKSESEKNILITNTLNEWKNCKLWLQDAKALFITFGSSWVYEYTENSLLVANCHKVPSNQFTKRLLTVEEITKAFSTILPQLKNINQHLQIILTVSPVKHLRDGMVENNRSKSILLLAAHALSEKLEYVNYYPAYELVNDDLRDYRFYKEDLAHPNEMAEQYVWEHFSNTFFTGEVKTLMNEVELFFSGLNHRPQHNNSSAHQAFLNSLLDKTRYLQSQGISMTHEAEQIKKQLIS